MKTSGWLVLIAIIAGAAAGGFFLGLHYQSPPKAPAAEEADAPKPLAQVVTVPLRQGSIAEPIVAYGSVVAESGDVRIVSAPFESRIDRVLVIAGEHVAAGDELVQIASSPDALASLAEAKNAAVAAEKDLEQTQQRFNDHLATNADLLQAQQAVQIAKLKLGNMLERGVGSNQSLKAQSAGIISKIDVQAGQTAAAGSPLVEIASAANTEVVLGIEPDDLAYLKVGQAVELSGVGRASDQSITGHVRVMGQRVDPATRLASAIVSLPPDTHWMLDSYVSAKFAKDYVDALIAPRAALVPEKDSGYSIFTIKDAKAVEHDVKLGAENDRECQIIADDVKPGDPVVTVGSHELEDGMAVQIAADATQPATRPAPATEAAP